MEEKRKGRPSTGRNNRIIMRVTDEELELIEKFIDFGYCSTRTQAVVYALKLADYMTFSRNENNSQENFVDFEDLSVLDDALRLYKEHLPIWANDETLERCKKMHNSVMSGTFKGVFK